MENLARHLKTTRERAESPLKGVIAFPIQSRGNPGTLTPNPADCPTCGGFGFLRVSVEPGHPQFGKPIACPGPAHQAARLVRLARVSGLTEADLARRLSDIKLRPDGSNRAVLAAAQSIINDPFGWLYLWGGPGNAKSEVLIAIVNELGRRGYPVLYTRLTKLLDYMRDAYGERKKRDAGFDTDQGYLARFEQVKSVRVLAIDEFDKARLTEFAEEFRFSFLDERYRQGISGQTITIFASNSDPAGLPEPIYDRIRDGRFKIIHNTAGSARPHMRRDSQGHLSSKKGA